MSEMVERVARAIWQATPLKPGAWNDDLQLWERASGQEQKTCYRQAVSAIEAMRELTETMNECGYAVTRNNVEEVERVSFDSTQGNTGHNRNSSISTKPDTVAHQFEIGKGPSP